MFEPQMKCTVWEEKDDPEAQWFAFQCMLCEPTEKKLITNYSSKLRQGDKMMLNN